MKAKYFREMKRFISIPNHFKGVGEQVEGLIFPAIIDRHAEGFVTCYRKADILFKRLAAVQEQFKVSFITFTMTTRFDLCITIDQKLMFSSLNSVR